MHETKESQRAKIISIALELRSKVPVLVISRDRDGELAGVYEAMSAAVVDEGAHVHAHMSACVWSLTRDMHAHMNACVRASSQDK